MTNNSFTHDEEAFESAADDGLRIDDGDTRYAQLFTEVIWDGVITAEKRHRLVLAAETFGLTTERANQIEAAISAAGSIQQLEVQERVGESDDWLNPFGGGENPRMTALKERVEQLESDKKTLKLNVASQEDDIQRLTQQITQLQEALNSTLEELEKLHSGPLDDANAGEGSRDRLSIPDDRQSRTVNRGASSGVVKSDAYIPIAEDGYENQTVRLTPALTDIKDPAELHRVLAQNPRDATLLHQMFQRLKRGRDTDQRYNVAQALVFLKEANAEERALFRLHRPEKLPRPTRALNDDNWRELLMHPTQERLLGDIFAAIAPATFLSHLTASSTQGDQARPKEDQRVSPTKSDQPAARSVAWCAAVLGLQTPGVFVDPDRDTSFELVLNPEPVTVVGAKALANKSEAQLAFGAAQHLSWHRRQHILGHRRVARRWLEDLFLAALTIGNPGLPMADDVRIRVTPVAEVLRPLLDGATLAYLKQCFVQFVSGGGRTNLKQWLSGVDDTALRVGMLMSNDLAAAYHCIKRQRHPDRRKAIDELILFVTCQDYSALRKRIGIGIDTA